MKLKDLYEALCENNVEAKLNTKENRIEITDTENNVDQYISETFDEKLKVEVYLANKTTADTITKEDFKECMKRRDELIDRLNSLPLPILFNIFGETE